MKTCYVCNENKNDTEFHKHKGTTDGLRHEYKLCRKAKKLFVDHDHETGRVRGLLCTTCNTGIGMLKDNIDTLKQAIIYLSK